MYVSKYLGDNKHNNRDYFLSGALNDARNKVARLEEKGYKVGSSTDVLPACTYLHIRLWHENGDWQIVQVIEEPDRPAEALKGG